MARNTTLLAAAANGRRSTDAGDPGPGGKVWAVRLPAHYGVVAERGMAGGEGSSAADLATRRAESAAETAGARAVVAGRWIVCALASRAGESRVELRLWCAMKARRKRWVRSSLLSLLAFDRLLQCSPAQEKSLRGRGSSKAYRVPTRRGKADELNCTGHRHRRCAGLPHVLW